MSKPFDASLKDLVADYPADWLAFLGVSAESVEVLDADVSTVSANADKVLRIESDNPGLLHVELQSSQRTDPGEQLQWYNTLLRHRHRLPVRTVIVLLRPEADSPRYNGVYQHAFPGEPPYLEFHYQVVRVWQIAVEKFITGGLGLLPLATLADVPEEGLPTVIHRMGERLAREASPEQEALLWTATFVLTGLRLPSEALAPLFQGVRLMRESSAYTLIHIEEARKIILRLGRKRLGPADPTTIAALEATFNLEQLENMIERVVDATSWEEVLTTP